MSTGKARSDDGLGSGLAAGAGNDVAKLRQQVFALEQSHVQLHQQLSSQTRLLHHMISLLNGDSASAPRGTMRQFEARNQLLRHEVGALADYHFAALRRPQSSTARSPPR